MEYDKKHKVTKSKNILKNDMNNDYKIELLDYD